VIPFKTTFGFEEKIRITPNGIDIYAESNGDGAFNAGDWVVLCGTDFLDPIPTIQTCDPGGDPGPDAVLGVCVEGITIIGSGWVRILGRVTASLDVGVLTGQALAVTLGATSAGVYVAGKRAGVALSDEVGGSGTVWVG